MTDYEKQARELIAEYHRTGLFGHIASALRKAKQEGLSIALSLLPKEVVYNKDHSHDLCPECWISSDECYSGGFNDCRQQIESAIKKARGE